MTRALALQSRSDLLDGALYWLIRTRSAQGFEVPPLPEPVPTRMVPRHYEELT